MNTSVLCDSLRLRVFAVKPAYAAFTAKTRRRKELLNWLRLGLVVSGPCVVLLLLCLAIPAFPEEIDRLLVAVNGRVVTEGDLRLAHNLNAILAPARNGAERSGEEELNRLIDLELMRQELTNFAAIKADESEIEPRMQDLRNKYAEIGGLPALLRDLGLQESELRSYIDLQISIEKFIQFRFRPFVTVSPEEILAYYRQKLVPQLEKSSGARVPDLEEVTSQIEEILAQEKVNTAVDNWLKDIRGHSRIESFARPSA